MMSRTGHTVWKGDSLNLTTSETAQGRISTVLQATSAGPFACLMSVYTCPYVHHQGGDGLLHSVNCLNRYEVVLLQMFFVFVILFVYLFIFFV